MKFTTIQVKEDMKDQINLYKYKWGLKNHDQVIRRLFEICSKIKRADNYTQAASKEVEAKEIAEEEEVGGSFDRKIREIKE